MSNRSGAVTSARAIDARICIPRELARQFVHVAQADTTALLNMRSDANAVRRRDPAASETLVSMRATA